MSRRNTQEAPIAMKIEIINSCVAGKIKCLEGAKLLKMHPKSFLRLKKRYLQDGEAVLCPKPPGPKAGKTAKNRTPEYLENIICRLAKDEYSSGPVELSEKLYNIYHIKLNQSTIFRILERNRIRYCREYTPIIKRKPQLYCLETLGMELQIDACHPFGRGRKLVCFDAIDDCSRYVVAKLYDRETAENAIDFIKYLIKCAPFPIKRIRIDNRSKNAIKKFCESIGIEVVVNSAYEPKQNGKIERFHRTIKHSFFWKYCGFYDDVELMGYRLSGWINYYNFHRRHGGYGMNRLTPVQKMTASLFNSLNIILVEKVTLTLQSYKC